jgi:hypothetical protein
MNRPFGSIGRQSGAGSWTSAPNRLDKQRQVHDSKEKLLGIWRT